MEVPRPGIGLTFGTETSTETESVTTAVAT